MTQNNTIAENSFDTTTFTVPAAGTTALGVNSLVARQQPSMFDIGIGAICSIPNNDIAKASNTLQAVKQAAAAAQNGSAIGVGMALAGAVPGSDFSEAMGKISALSNAAKAVRQGSMLGAGMSLAGLNPNSQFAQVVGDVSKAVGIVQQGLTILNPQIDPKTLIKYIQPPGAATPTKSPSSNTSSDSGRGIGGQDGAYIKGEGIKCPTCALGNQDVMVGAPVQALYGSKILIGGDDIDYSGTGYLPFVMSRVYNSQNTDIGWFGQGWTTQGYEQRLELDPQHNRIYLIDNSGRRVPFTYLAPGQSCFQPSERITLYRKPLSEDKKHTTASSRPILADATNGSRIGEHEPLEFVIYRGQYTPSQNADTPAVDSFDGLAQHYSYVAKRDKRGTSATILLSSYGDKYGHQIQLHYTRDSQSGIAHIPQYLTEDVGACYELELTDINKQIRLSKLYLIDSAQRQDSPNSIKRVTLASYQYSDDGDLIEVTQRDRITRTFDYQNHLMVAQSQPNGQQAVYRYDQYDNAKSARVVEHGISSGRHYLFAYDIDSEGVRSTTVTEQPGSKLERSRRFEYDDWYNLLSSTDYLGNTTRFEVDDNNRTIKVSRANGSQTHFNYQGNHLACVQIQTSISNLTKLPTYREISYQYNHLGKVTAITDAIGNTQHFTYNARGELDSQTDAVGNTTTFTYDNHGNIIRQTLANGSGYTFDYDKAGNLITQTDCSGYQTHYTYDDKHRLIQNEDAEGNTTRYHYHYTKAHLEHLISQVTYPDGSHIQMDYDEKARLIRYTDAKGHTVKYDYSADGQPTRREETKSDNDHSDTTGVKRINESGQALTYSYDILGRLTRLTNENGEQWTFDYDANDNITSESRFDGHQSQYYYNSLGQMTQQIDNPQLSKVHQRHIYNEYNLAGELTHRHSCHYPDIIDPNHTQTHKSAKPEYLRVHYDYDSSGRLMSVSNPDSRISFDYDPAGRLISETLISHLTGQYSAREHTLTHDYDELGNRIKTILPDGKQLNQAYYGSGHLYNQSLYKPADNQHIELRHSERNKVHQEIIRQQGVLQTNYHYDPMGRLLNQQSKTDRHITIERHYHYDVLGQLTHLSGHSSFGLAAPNTTFNSFRRNHQYEYDGQGRLTQHRLTDYQNQSGITEVFAFDPASNRVPVSVQSASTESDNTSTQQAPATIGRPTELITEDQRIRYTYDTHGRMLYKTTESINETSTQPKKALHLQYNANNEVVKSLTREYQGKHIKQTCTRYHYDAFGRRLAKHSDIRQLTKDGDALKAIQKPTYQHTHMLWDGDKLIQEYSDTHVFTTVYDQASFAPVARLVWLREHFIDEQVSEQEKEWLTKFNHKERETRVNLREIPSFYDDYAKKDKLDNINSIKVYYYHNDQLGTPNELTDDKGQVVWLADFEAWGNISKEEYQSQSIGDFEISAKELQPIRFQGQNFDEETGLHYNRFRYYDPDLGMFISRDPIGLNGGDNVFAYAPNPTGFIDPLGLECKNSQSGAYEITTCNTKLGNMPPIIFKTPGDSVGYKPNATGRSYSQVVTSWPDTMNKNSDNYHAYNIQMNYGKQSQKVLKDVQQCLLSNPVYNNNPNRVTVQGVPNDATPNRDPYRVVQGNLVNNDVTSYLRTDANNNPMVVNVTKPTHVLFPGFVVRRASLNASGELIVDNYGEGTGGAQSFGWVSDLAVNKVWIPATDSCVEEVMGSLGRPIIEGKVNIIHY